MNWAITLQLDDRNTIEQRLQRILSYLLTKNLGSPCMIYEIDATGEQGNILTQKLNYSKKPIETPLKDIMKSITENGQIFELNFVCHIPSLIRVIIRNGSSLDIVGVDERLPAGITGDYLDLDPKLFLL